MLLIFVILSALICLLIGYSDVRNREIPNFLVAVIFVYGIVNSLLNGFLIQSTLITLLVFVLFLVFWKINVIGGGDVKLIVAFSFGLLPSLIVPMICFAGLLGGGQLVVMYSIAKLRNQPPFERGVPYGIPIVISGWFFSLLSSKIFY